MDHFQEAQQHICDDTLVEGARGPGDRRETEGGTEAALGPTACPDPGGCHLEGTAMVCTKTKQMLSFLHNIFIQMASDEVDCDQKPPPPIRGAV